MPETAPKQGVREQQEMGSQEQDAAGIDTTTYPITQQSPFPLHVLWGVTGLERVCFFHVSLMRSLAQDLAMRCLRKYV